MTVLGGGTDPLLQHHPAASPASPSPKPGSLQTHTHTRARAPGWRAAALRMLKNAGLPESHGPGHGSPPCSPAKDWAGGRWPSDSPFAIPGWDRMGCRDSVPPALPTGASQVARGLLQQPGPPPTHGSGSVRTKGRPPRRHLCGSWQREADRGAQLDTPIQGPRRAAGAQRQRQRRARERSPRSSAGARLSAPLLHSAPSAPPRARARAPGRGEGGARRAPAQRARAGPGRHLLVNIPCFPWCMWLAFMNIYDYYFSFLPLPFSAGLSASLMNIQKLKMRTCSNSQCGFLTGRAGHCSFTMKE